MANTMVMFDPAAPSGQRFKSTAVQEEIGEIAPKTVDPGSITGDKLADLAVSGDKIANGAVTSAKIGTGEVKTANLEDEGVTADKLAPASLTLAAVGAGVMGVQDSDGNAITLNAQRITTTAYAALTVVDPNILYLIVAG